MGVDPKDLSKRRFLLGNPYAHLEQLFEAEFRDDARDAWVRCQRRLFQNPYMLIELLDDASVTDLAPAITHPRSAKEIEEIVTQVQRKLWADKSQLWLDNAPVDPVEILDVSMAAKIVGFKFDLLDSLGVYTDRSERIEVAGVLDRSTHSIRISRAFPRAVRHFTAAHELGHLFLHPDMELVHRDRAIDGSRIARAWMEVEADKFATIFLMPAKLVRRAFAQRFLTLRFELNDDTAFALHQQSLEDTLAEFRTRRHLSRELASTNGYNGKNFNSLAEYFAVSNETMAIRLEELQLVVR